MFIRQNCSLEPSGIWGSDISCGRACLSLTPFIGVGLTLIHRKALQAIETANFNDLEPQWVSELTEMAMPDLSIAREDALHNRVAGTSKEHDLLNYKLRRSYIVNAVGGILSTALTAAIIAFAVISFGSAFPLYALPMCFFTGVYLYDLIKNRQFFCARPES